MLLQRSQAETLRKVRQSFNGDNYFNSPESKNLSLINFTDNSRSLYIPQSGSKERDPLDRKPSTSSSNYQVKSMQMMMK